MGLILAFMAGSIFTLILSWACITMSFRLSGHKEESSRVQEKKRKAREESVRFTGGVVTPRTDEQRKMDQDEEFQEVSRIIKFE